MPKENIHPALRKRAAYHEAGHTVVNYRLEFPSYEVTIRANPTAGCGIVKGDCFRPEDEVITLYAGLAAERLVCPGAPVEVAWLDYEQADEILGPEPSEKHEQRAADLVREHRQAIDAVAEALLEYETLPGDEVEIVVGCVDAGDDWREELEKYRALRRADELKGR